MNLELNPGDLVVLGGPDRKLAVIRDLNPSRPKNDLVISLSGQSRRHKCPSGIVEAVVGRADLDALDGCVPAPPSLSYSGDGLDGKEPGDPIKVRHGGQVVEVEFCGINSRARKYPVQYVHKGKRWKAALDQVVG